MTVVSSTMPQLAVGSKKTQNCNKTIFSMIFFDSPLNN
jgi:hypothetical protein